MYLSKGAELLAGLRKELTHDFGRYRPVEKGERFDGCRQVRAIHLIIDTPEHSDTRGKGGIL